MDSSWVTPPTSSTSISIYPSEDTQVDAFRVAAVVVGFVLLALVAVLCTKLAHKIKHKDDLKECKGGDKPKSEPEKPKPPAPKAEEVRLCICNSMVPCGSYHCNYCGVCCHQHRGCYCGNRC